MPFWGGGAGAPTWDRCRYHSPLWLLANRSTFNNSRSKSGSGQCELGQATEEKKRKNPPNSILINLIAAHHAFRKIPGLIIPASNYSIRPPWRSPKDGWISGFAALAGRVGRPLHRESRASSKGSSSGTSTGSLHRINPR